MRVIVPIISLLLLSSFYPVKGETVSGPWQAKAPKINKERLLKAHNQYRELVKVPPLQWSDKLAMEAQHWADSLALNCTVFRKRGKHGENLYWTSTKKTETQVVEFWAKERKYFDRQAEPIYDPEKSDWYKHYSQIIWASTTHLGAGRRKCASGDEIWVVFYNPKGNIEGELAF